MKRPQTRAECPAPTGGVRRCPWYGCRHHIGLFVDKRGRLQLVVPPDPTPGYAYSFEDSPYSLCSLDHAEENRGTGAYAHVHPDSNNLRERDGRHMTLESIANVLGGLSRERIRQIEKRGQIAMLENADADLRPGDIDEPVIQSSPDPAPSAKPRAPRLRKQDVKPKPTKRATPPEKKKQPKKKPAPPPRMDEAVRRAGELIREARRRLGLTQRELAEKAGVSRSLISTIEKGHRPATEKCSQRIEHALGLPRKTLPTTSYGVSRMKRGNVLSISDISMFLDRLGVLLPGDEHTESQGPVDVAAHMLCAARAASGLSSDRASILSGVDRAVLDVVEAAEGVFSREIMGRIERFYGFPTGFLPDRTPTGKLVVGGVGASIARDDLGVMRPMVMERVLAKAKETREREQVHVASTVALGPFFDPASRLLLKIARTKLIPVNHRRWSSQLHRSRLRVSASEALEFFQSLVDLAEGTIGDQAHQYPVLKTLQTALQAAVHRQ